MSMERDHMATGPPQGKRRQGNVRPRDAVPVRGTCEREDTGEARRREARRVDSMRITRAWLTSRSADAALMGAVDPEMAEMAEARRTTLALYAVGTAAMVLA